MNSLTLFLPTKFLQWTSQCSVTQLGEFPHPPWLNPSQAWGREAEMAKPVSLNLTRSAVTAMSPPPATSQIITKEIHPGPGPIPLATVLSLLAPCKLQRFIQGRKTLGWNQAWRLQAHHALPEWSFNELEQITCTVLTWLPKGAQSKMPFICNEPIFNFIYFLSSFSFSFLVIWSSLENWGRGTTTQQTQKENINISFGILHNISQWQQQVFDRPANFPKTTSCQPGCDSGMSQCWEMGCCQPLPQPKMPSPLGLVVY